MDITIMFVKWSTVIFDVFMLGSSIPNHPKFSYQEMMANDEHFFQNLV